MTADPEAVAAALLQAVADAAPGAEAAVTVEHRELALTRFANSAIHQNHDEDTVTARVLVHLDGRTATVSTGVGASFDPAGTAAAALDAARSGPADPAWPGVAPAEPLPDAPTAGVAMATAEQRAAAVLEFVESAGGLVTAGYCQTAVHAVAFADSAGQRATRRGVEATIDGIARDAGVDGVARATANTLTAIDAAALGALAAAKARAGLDPVELPPGRYAVLLEPAAVVDLLGHLATSGFNGRALVDGRSFVRLGEQQFDAQITIVDDGPSCGVTFDAEGTPRPRRTMVARGVPAAIAHDRRTAAEAGASSTGHGLGSAAFGAVALHLGIEPSDRSPVPLAAAVHPAAAALVGAVDDGLLVTDFWYTRVLDPRSLAVTGLTRNGVWRIRDGELAEPVKNLRFTQAYPAALAPGAVLGVGGSTVAQADGWLPARWTAPALRLASWNFTGGSSG